MCEYTVEQAIAMALQHIRICAPDPVVDAALEAALLERQASAVPDGWAMVPRDSTVGMLNAVKGSVCSVRVAEDDCVEYPISEDELAEIYKNMVAAAPSTEVKSWKHAAILQNAEAAKQLRIGWDKEVDDADKIVEKLGLTVEQARTDGGCLHLPRILNHIQETLDALAIATDLAVAMSDKYVASNKQLNEAAKKLAAMERAMEEASEWEFEGTIEVCDWVLDRAAEILRGE